MAATTADLCRVALYDPPRDVFALCRQAPVAAVRHTAARCVALRVHLDAALLRALRAGSCPSGAPSLGALGAWGARVRLQRAEERHALLLRAVRRGSTAFCAALPRVGVPLVPAGGGGDSVLGLAEAAGRGDVMAAVFAEAPACLLTQRRAAHALMRDAEERCALAALAASDPMHFDLDWIEIAAAREAQPLTRALAARLACVCGWGLSAQMLAALAPRVRATRASADAVRREFTRLFGAPRGDATFVALALMRLLRCCDAAVAREVVEASRGVDWTDAVCVEAARGALGFAAGAGAADRQLAVEYAAVRACLDCGNAAGLRGLAAAGARSRVEYLEQDGLRSRPDLFAPFAEVLRNSELRGAGDRESARRILSAFEDKRFALGAPPEYRAFPLVLDALAYAGVLRPSDAAPPLAPPDAADRAACEEADSLAPLPAGNDSALACAKHLAGRWSSDEPARVGRGVGAAHHAAWERLAHRDPAVGRLLYESALRLREGGASFPALTRLAAFACSPARCLGCAFRGAPAADAAAAAAARRCAEAGSLAPALGLPRATLVACAARLARDWRPGATAPAEAAAALAGGGCEAMRELLARDERVRLVLDECLTRELLEGAPPDPERVRALAAAGARAGAADAQADSARVSASAGADTLLEEVRRVPRVASTQTAPAGQPPQPRDPGVEEEAYASCVASHAQKHPGGRPPGRASAAARLERALRRGDAEAVRSLAAFHEPEAEGASVYPRGALRRVFRAAKAERFSARWVGLPRARRHRRK